MPFDGTDYQPEQTLEEEALRYADNFFTDESKWHRGSEAHGPRDSMCVGQALIGGIEIHWRGDWAWATEVCGRTETVQEFNESCPSFATMKAHLRKRIKHYEDERLKVTA